MRCLMVPLLTALVASAALAEGEASIYCGSFRCVTVRAAAHGLTAEQRVDWAMGLLNKYLGGKRAQFNSARSGSDTQIMLNGEVLLAVTPADARAERVASVSALAQRWKVSIARAFAATSAQK